jgi:hypothetical protein
VKAFVLLSPPQVFKGMSTHRALDHPIVRKRLSAMIVYGRGDASSAKTAKRVHSMLARFHPEPNDPEDIRQKDLFLIGLDTSLRGTKLLDAEGLRVKAKIAGFIKLRLVERRANYPWTDRTSPLAQ